MRGNLLQLYSFMQTFMGGAVCALLYDLTVRGIFAGARHRSAAEAVYALCAFSAVLAVLISAGDLLLRLYMVLGLGGGAAVYFWLFSPFVIDIINTLRAAADKAYSAADKTAGDIKNRLTVKYAGRAARVKTVCKRLLSLPKRIKTGYNRYAKYFFGGGRDDREKNAEDRTRRDERK